MEHDIVLFTRMFWEPDSEFAWKLQKRRKKWCDHLSATTKHAYAQNTSFVLQAGWQHQTNQITQQQCISAGSTNLTLRKCWIFYFTCCVCLYVCVCLSMWCVRLYTVCESVFIFASCAIQSRCILSCVRTHKFCPIFPRSAFIAVIELYEFFFLLLVWFSFNWHDDPVHSFDRSRGLEIVHHFNYRRVMWQVVFFTCEFPA